MIKLLCAMTQRIINCPTCEKQDAWKPTNTFKPFCSEHCKLIDLGEWASETRKIASEPLDELVDPLA